MLKHACSCHVLSKVSDALANASAVPPLANVTTPLWMMCPQGARWRASSLIVLFFLPNMFSSQQGRLRAMYDGFGRLRSSPNLAESMFQPVHYDKR